MNGSVFFSKARYMNRVGFEILARTPVPNLPKSYPPLPPHTHTHTHTPKVWSECAIAVALLIPLWSVRLSKVNTISECFDQNVQLRRLTRVFACRTRRFVTSRDYRRYIWLAKALIRLLMFRLRVCRLTWLFVQILLLVLPYTHARSVCAKLYAALWVKFSTGILKYFSHFSIWHFMQIVSIAWNVKSCFLLHEMSNLLFSGK